MRKKNYFIIETIFLLRHITPNTPVLVVNNPIRS